MKEWELVHFCESDKYAEKSYCKIHSVDPSLNLGDITKVNEYSLKPFTMICGGSPCQDFSVAGKRKGSVWKCKRCGLEYNPIQIHYTLREYCPKCFHNKLDKSRSSLLVEYLRIVRANRPNFGIYENVKNIVGKQFKNITFKLFENELRMYGYNIYWKVLNVRDYGVPQNRERVYLIFIKKDLDNCKFVFPEGFDNGIRLKDVLEDEVDEKYYISDDKVQRFLTNLNTNTSLLYNPRQVKREGKSREYNDYCPTLTSRDYKDPKLVNENVVKQVGNISDCNGIWENPQVGRIYDPNGCSPTLNTCGGGSHEPKILQVGNVNPSGKGMNGNVFLEDGLAPTLTTNKGEGNKILTGIRIRKLTPKETFRLMGFPDSAYEAASKVVSDSQLYKQSGNSIVVDVIYYIMIELYEAMPYLFDNLKLCSLFSGIGAFEKALDWLYVDINKGGEIIAKICPETKNRMTYLDCMECEEKTCKKRKESLIKGVILKFGDAIEFSTLFNDYIYYYCGKIEDRFLIYGGVVKEGIWYQEIVIKEVEQNFFKKLNLKKFEVVGKNVSYAKAVKKRYIERKGK